LKLDVGDVMGGHVLELLRWKACLWDGISLWFLLCVCARWVEGTLVTKPVSSRVPKFCRRFYCGIRHVELFDATQRFRKKYLLLFKNPNRSNIWQMLLSKYEQHLIKYWSYLKNAKFWSCWDTLLSTSDER
jgi:hypothetical protein